MGLRFDRDVDYQSDMISGSLVTEAHARRTIGLVGVLFFMSGIPALLYQIVWQRALFAIYGIDTASVTAVVAAFMLGLGLGSLLGGRISKMAGVSLLLAFGVAELLVGAFGFASLAIFDGIGDATLGASSLQTGALAFVMVVLPTVLMGATLPLLTTFLVRDSGSVGASLGLLYFLNTMGAAAACLLAATLVMRMLGMQGTINLAATLNLLIGAAGIVAHFNLGPSQTPLDGATPATEVGTTPWQTPPLPFAIALVLSACTGFISLSYEILWIRAYAYASQGHATGFALLLGSYLAGIALGSLLGKRIAATLVASDPRRTLWTIGMVVLVVNLLAFAVVPLTSHSVLHVKIGIMLLYVMVASIGFGALFPLIAHASVSPDRNVGQRLSYLYVANIVGSTLGSLVTGFIAMDLWGFATVATVLASAGALFAAILLVLGTPADRRAPGRLFAMALLLVAVIAGGRFAHADMHGRLLFREKFPSSAQVTRVIETRSGTCTVTAEGKLYGSGVYDGEFKIDLRNDSNKLLRPASISAFHAAPERMLVIGLGTGSWAQLVAQHPQVKHTTIIELNEGQPRLIQSVPRVASLLTNPKVTVVMDDARRWLKQHPEATFDAIVMNTTYHWRSNSTNLLSDDFLRLIQRHLRPGGLALYNATSSPESYKTGATVFPYAVRVLNSMLVSDSPLVPNKVRWRDTLIAYRIDGAPLFDAQSPADQVSLEKIVDVLDTLNEPTPDESGMEPRESLLARLTNVRVITDDNMATEWQQVK